MAFEQHAFSLPATCRFSIREKPFLSKKFYTAEYAKAFPMMSDYRAYGYRVFNRLFRFIGLCEINERDEDKGRGWGQKVIKTEALDMIFSFEE